MAQVKLAVIYYSSTGGNYQLAQWAAEAAREAGAEVSLLRIAETAPEAAIHNNPLWKEHTDAVKDMPVVTLNDLEQHDAYIFSMPTRYGSPPSQLRTFLDTTGGLWFTGKLANKVVSAMATAQNAHGGQESTLLSFYNSMHHWGAIVVSPGYTDPSIFAAGGNPYGTSATVADGKVQGDIRPAVAHQARRVVQIAAKLIG